MEIKNLPQDVRNNLQSSLTVNSVVQCIVELVLNSLDANATAIAIRINLLKFQIQIVDNGDGISESNLNFVGLRYMTSKCKSLSDLAKKAKYFGFKGESLSSIFNISKRAIIVSKARGSSKTYKKNIENGKHNEIIEEKNRTSCGTTITIENFMYNLQVRQKRVKPDIDLDTIRKILESIAIINPNVSFSLRNDVCGKIILSSHKNDSVVEVFCNFYPEVEITDFSQIKIAKSTIKVSGLLSKKLTENNKLQFMYVNKRPVQSQKLQKLFSALLHKRLDDYNDRKTSFPLYVVNISCPHLDVDFSVNTKKPTVEFKQWNIIQKCVEKMIDKFLGKKIMTVAEVHQIEDTKQIQINNNNEYSVSQFCGAVRSVTAKRKALTQTNEVPKKQLKYDDILEMNLDVNSEKISIRQKQVSEDISSKEVENCEEHFAKSPEKLKKNKKINILNVIELNGFNKINDKRKNTKIETNRITEDNNIVLPPNIQENESILYEDNLKNQHHVDHLFDKFFKKPPAKKVIKKNRKRKMKQKCILKKPLNPKITPDLSFIENTKTSKRCIEERNFKDKEQVFYKSKNKKSIFERHLNTQSLVLNTETNMDENLEVDNPPQIANETGKEFILHKFLKSVTNEFDDINNATVKTFQSNTIIARTEKTENNNYNTTMTFSVVMTHKTFAQNIVDVYEFPEKNSVSKFMGEISFAVTPKKRRLEKLNNICKKSITNNITKYVQTDLLAKNLKIKADTISKSIQTETIKNSKYLQTKFSDKVQHFRHHEAELDRTISKYFKQTFPDEFSFAIPTCSRETQQNLFFKFNKFSNLQFQNSTKKLFDIKNLKQTNYKQNHMITNTEKPQMFSNYNMNFNHGIVNDFTLELNNQQSSLLNYTNQNDYFHNDFYNSEETICRYNNLPLENKIPTNLEQKYVVKPILKKDNPKCFYEDVKTKFNFTEFSEGCFQNLEKVTDVPKKDKVKRGIKKDLKLAKFSLHDVNLSPIPKENMHSKNKKRNIVDQTKNNSFSKYFKHKNINPKMKKSSKVTFDRFPTPFPCNNKNFNCNNENVKLPFNFSKQPAIYKPIFRNYKSDPNFQYERDLNLKCCSSLNYSVPLINNTYSSENVIQITLPTNQTQNNDTNLEFCNKKESYVKRKKCIEMDSTRLSNILQFQRVPNEEKYENKQIINAAFNMQSPTNQNFEKNFSKSINNSSSLLQFEKTETKSQNYIEENASELDNSTFSNFQPKFRSTPFISKNDLTPCTLKSTKVNVDNNSFNSKQMFEKQQINASTDDVTNFIEELRNGKKNNNNVLIKTLDTQNNSVECISSSKVSDDLIKNTNVSPFSIQNFHNYQKETVENYGKGLETNCINNTEFNEINSNDIQEDKQIKSNVQIIQNNLENESQIEQSPPLIIEIDEGDKQNILNKMKLMKNLMEKDEINLGSHTTQETNTLSLKSGFQLRNSNFTVKEKDDSQDNEMWIKQTNSFGSIFYINKRTGMTSFYNPNDDKQFNFIKRLEFIPKGMSPILEETERINISLSPISKEKLKQALLDCYSEELDIIKWKNCIKDIDVKEFFLNIYKQRTKIFEDVIPSVQQNNYSTFSFSKEILSNLEVIGQVDLKFIAAIIQTKKFLILLDQHAVHERIRLEQLYIDYKESGCLKFKTKKCKAIVTVELSETDMEIAKNHQEIFNNMGIIFTINEKQMNILEVPLCFLRQNETNFQNLITVLITEIIETLKETRGVFANIPKTIQNTINSEACRGAIKFGDKLSKDKCISLLSGLSKCDLPFQCAHGRPTMVPIMEFNKYFWKTMVKKPQLQKLKSTSINTTKL